LERPEDVQLKGSESRLGIGSQFHRELKKEQELAESPKIKPRPSRTTNSKIEFPVLDGSVDPKADPVDVSDLDDSHTDLWILMSILSPPARIPAMSNLARILIRKPNLSRRRPSPAPLMLSSFIQEELKLALEAHQRIESVFSGLPTQSASLYLDIKLRMEAAIARSAVTLSLKQCLKEIMTLPSNFVTHTQANYYTPRSLYDYGNGKFGKIIHIPTSSCDVVHPIRQFSHYPTALLLQNSSLNTNGIYHSTI
jgi:hypothetical protein